MQRTANLRALRRAGTLFPRADYFAVCGALARAAAIGIEKGGPTAALGALTGHSCTRRTFVRGGPTSAGVAGIRTKLMARHMYAAIDGATSTGSTILITLDR